MNVKVMAFVPLVLAGECRLCPSDPCDDDSPCPGDLVCTNGQCAIPCETVESCPLGSRLCQDPGGGVAVCVDADGVPGQVCIDDE